MNYKNKIPVLLLLLNVLCIQQAFSQDITTCHNRPISIDDLTVTTDAGTAIDASACTYAGDLTAYMNCVAEKNDIPAGSSFLLELEKGSDLNGVSTLDLIILIRDLLVIEPLDNTCKVVAADLDGDNKVNVKDLVLMRRLILGMIEELPIDSWRFFNSSEINITGIGPDTDLVFAKDAFPLTDLKIKGIKVGDLNNSVSP